MNDPNASQIAAFKVALESGGLPAGLGYLNSLTPHRFTGLFLSDGEMLRNVALYDRSDPNAAPWDAFPMLHSYCSIILATGESFSTSSAMEDPRLLDHAARESVRSYCGVPLLDAEGHVIGTLCHFDFIAQPAEVVNPELMLAIPELIAPYIGAIEA